MTKYPELVSAILNTNRQDVLRITLDQISDTTVQAAVITDTLRRYKVLVGSSFFFEVSAKKVYVEWYRLNHAWFICAEDSRGYEGASISISRHRSVDIDSLSDDPSKILHKFPIELVKNPTEYRSTLGTNNVQKWWTQRTLKELETGVTE